MARPKILLTRRWPDVVEAELRRDYEVAVDPDDRPLTAGALAEAMRTHDAVCPTVSDRIDASVLGVTDRRAGVLVNYGAGVEHIDLAAARAAGIPVANTPGVLTDATADLAMVLTLMATRRAGEGERELRAGQWSGWRPTHLLGQSLAGKTMGLFGFGRIGQATARRARAFGMEIAYSGRRRIDAGTERDLGARFVETLDELAAVSDVLSLHCPGGQETRHLINAERLAAMKSTSVIVNTARGSVINEQDLADALRDGRIAAAGLDVYETEPHLSRALLDAPNTVLLPHLGSATIEARIAMGRRAKANLDRFFAGDALPDHVR